MKQILDLSSIIETPFCSWKWLSMEEKQRKDQQVFLPKCISREGSPAHRNKIWQTKYYFQTSNSVFFTNQPVVSFPVMFYILESEAYSLLPSCCGVTSFLNCMFCQLSITAIAFARYNHVTMLHCSVMTARYRL